MITGRVDPFFHFERFLDEVKVVGHSGIQNFPTIGPIDGKSRANLEETGMNYGQEVDLIRLARARDLLTTPYAFNRGDAGADIVVAHSGLTTRGNIGTATAALSRIPTC